MTTEPKQPTLRRALGVFDGVALLVGITIGAGIYSTPQLIAGYINTFKIILLLWLVVGIYVFLSGMIYAELGTRLPNTGGEYIYISRAYGPFTGFLFGWAQLFIIRTSPAAGLAIIAADYLGYFVKFEGISKTLVALFIIVFFGALNYIGIQKASFYQKISSLLKVGGLFAFVVAGLLLIPGQENLLATRSTAVSGLSPVASIVAALMMVFFAHTGWERLGYAAGEMKNPRKIIPLSLFLGIGIIVSVYILTNLIYHWTLGMDGVRGSTVVASDAAIKLIGPLGAAFVSFLVIISTTGSINGTMMTATRVYYAMSRDGLFIKWLNYIHPKFRTPSRAVFIHCLWAAALLLIRGTFETLASGMVFAILIFLAFNTIALFKFRKKRIGGEGIFKVPGYPYLPLIFLTGIILLIGFRLIFEWQQSLADLAFMATGIPFYFLLKQNRKPTEKI